MKKNYFLTILSLFFCFAIQSVNAQFTLASDNASDAAYSGGLADGNNGGSGFSAWSLTIGGSTGTFVSNPSNDGMGTTGIGTTAWGFYATGSNYINALRPMSNGMEVGDTFTFYWAMNFDTFTAGANKGFDFKKSDGTTIFNVNNSNSATITTTNGNADTNYGTSPMLVTLTRTSGSQYSFSMTSRSGGATYSTTISSSETIDRINIYSGNQNQGDGQRNIYFNEFSVQNDGSFNIPSGSETYSKNLTGAGNLSKAGAGTLVLSGTNTYSGTTTVSAGTLQLNSSIASSSVTVNSGATLQISENATISSLTVDAGGIVIVDSGKSLTITNNLVNNGTSFTVNSGASLMVGGTSSGNITYTRTLGSANWYLVSAPLGGETVTDFMGAHSLATGMDDANNRGLSTYKNDGTAWNYYQNGYAGGDTFDAAQGFGVKLASAGDISFTGTMPVADVGIAITSNTNAFNLVGNPYPSYIAANNNADATNNILKVNDTDNDYLTESTIWLWDQSANAGAGGYEEVNHGTSFHIAPGQGFFVSANGSHTFSITEAMQSHQGTDTFQKTTNTRPEIQLVVNNGESTRDADIFYIDGTTTGFDNGYDSSIFGGVKNDFSIYTEAVANGTGKKLGIQSLPNSDLESMIIPIGIKAAAGEITFSANVANLPTDIKVFLEDRVANTFTRLDEVNSKYTVTLNADANGIGQFYLHTSKSSLSTKSVNLNNISVYTVNKATLKIVGLSQGKSSVKLFNLLGKQVLNTDFTTNGVSEIALPNLSSGIYIVQIENANGKMNKKIVLE